MGLDTGAYDTFYEPLMSSKNVKNVKDAVARTLYK
jgi:hypothetical protein